MIYHDILCQDIGLIFKSNISVFFKNFILSVICVLSISVSVGVSVFCIILRASISSLSYNKVKSKSLK